MDLTKMTTVQLTIAASNREGNTFAIAVELARRLEKAEENTTALNDEADAGRELDAAIVERDRLYASGADETAINLAWDRVKAAKLALKTAMAATDAARGGAE